MYTNVSIIVFTKTTFSASSWIIVHVSLNVFYSLMITYHVIFITEENRKELGRFAKNFHPILFNLFTESTNKKEERSHLAVLETIKCYMQITDPQLIYSFYDKCHDKLEEADITASRRSVIRQFIVYTALYYMYMVHVFTPHVPVFLA